MGLHLSSESQNFNNFGFACRRLRSALISARSDQFLLCAEWDVKADLNLPKIFNLSRSSKFYLQIVIYKDCSNKPKVFDIIPIQCYIKKELLNGS